MTMTDSVAYDQNMVGGGEVMEVMMTGGDGGEMNEDTLAQVVNMLQMEGQLAGGNHTIIIRQPGSNEIQMIQVTSNGGEVVVTKASEADIQALQAGNGVLANVDQDILESQQGQVVMMDEGGNLVEGVVQMQEDDQGAAGVVQIPQHNQMQDFASSQSVNVLQDEKDVESAEILDGLVQQIDGVGTQNLIDTALQPPDPPPVISAKPITISTTTNRPKHKIPISSNGDVVSIKINTGTGKRKEPKVTRVAPKNVIKISTVTGQQKYQPPKFHKCEACAINFVSKIAYMNHMENCPSKRKPFNPISNKGNITYTCVFCETKFTSRLVLMQHVRTCDKAKSSKSLTSGSKLKVTTSESKLKLVSSVSLPKTTKNVPNEVADKPKKVLGQNKFKAENKIRISGKKKSSTAFLDPEDEPYEEEKDLDSEYDDEKDIVYDDDDEDLNEEDMVEDDNIEDTLINKRSQKHLGPIIVKGMFKCRDCNRTFSKEYQYNRHVKACTNAPLNASRIDNDLGETQVNTIPVSAVEAATSIVGVKRKRGRPVKEAVNGDGGSPAKKRAVGPKIVSVNPKNVVGSSLHGNLKKKFMEYSDNESDEEIMDYLSGSSLSKEETFDRTEKAPRNKVTFKSSSVKSSKSGSFNSNSHSSISKIVKISPSDTLIKQTGKAILSKMNKEKYSKYIKDSPFCGLCGDKFKGNQELGLHTQLCHSEDLLNLRDMLDGKGNLSSLKCPLCDFHFVSSHRLLFHLVSFHDKDLKSTQEELQMQNLNLSCPFCTTISLSQDLLKEHMATKHLDKLINKPTSNVSPTAVDVNALIKEKNNGSILPTSKLLSKQEKVLCPDCGLFFLKSYFEHHKCASETYSPSARKFICSESQCTDMTFYKLIHLLTHLQQVHDKSLSCQMETFDSLTQFLEWLKKEESQTKMKYTKALQRMKQGKLSTVWICHRFHNAMKDPIAPGTTEENKCDRLNQCYSRIHAETSFNMSTSRYDGKTVIKYHPEHKHPSDNVSKDVSIQSKAEIPISTLPAQLNSNFQLFNTEEVRTVNTPSIHHPIDSFPQRWSRQNISPKSAFSNAAELKQLLEDDEDYEKTKNKDNSDRVFETHPLSTFPDIDPSDEVSKDGLIEPSDEGSKDDLIEPSDEGSKDDFIEHSDEIGKVDLIEAMDMSDKFNNDNESSEDTTSELTSQSLTTPKTKERKELCLDTEKSDSKMQSEEESFTSELSDTKIGSPEGEKEKETKENSGLIGLSDADLLLEKMLGEHDGGVEEGGTTSVNKEPLIDDIEKEPLMEGIEKEPLMEGIEKEPLMGGIEKETLMEGIEKETLMEGIEKETLMEGIEKEPLMEGIEKEPLMEDMEKEPIMEDMEKEPLMENMEKEPLMEDMEKETLMENIEKNTLMEDIEKQPLIDELEKEPLLGNTVKEPLLEEFDKEPITEKESPVVGQEITASLMEEETNTEEEEEEEENSQESVAAEMENLVPTESKISDVDMLKAFGVSSAAALSDCITTEESSSTSTASNTQQSSDSSEASQLLLTEQEREETAEGRDSEAEGEESTYVLPADIEEWNKLFELVTSQVSSESISGEDMNEAKSLLTYEDNILTIPIEKQVEVFNRLCALANVQMT